MNKMLTSLSTIIERWNETCLNQELSDPIRLKKNLVIYFCKILLKIILIRIVFRSAMATTSVLVFPRGESFPCNDCIITAVIGCYRDQLYSRTLPNVLNVPGITPAKCTQACIDANLGKLAAS